MKQKDSPQLHIFTGKVSLAVLAGLLQRCCLFLTTDSGPMHVGVAMNIPIVTMFGSSPVQDSIPMTPRTCSSGHRSPVIPVASMNARGRERTIWPA